jgi:hypothetical protein
MALVTLAKYKRAVGIDPNDTTDDQALNEALEAASVAAQNYAGRDFGDSAVTGDRTFTYDGSGILNIDDAVAVNTVRYSTSSTAMSAAAWKAKREGPSRTAQVYTHLILPTWTYPNGEMGFTYNLDVFIARHGWPSNYEADVVVNAEWGWPVVPEDVQRAVIFETADLYEGGAQAAAGGLTSKSVAEVSEAYFVNTDTATGSNEPLSSRARRLLDPYKRV